MGPSVPIFLVACTEDGNWLRLNIWHTGCVLVLMMCLLIALLCVLKQTHVSQFAMFQPE